MTESSRQSICERALVNFRMDPEKEEKMEEQDLEDMDVKTHIRFAVFAGHQDGEMSCLSLLFLMIRAYC